jgi:GNAT superfamily N-acetyltransferase
MQNNNPIAVEQNSAIIVRFATKEDTPLILNFIRALATYEQLEHEVTATEEILGRTLFGPHPYAECLIAEVNGEPCGCAMFFHNFSTFLGKPGLYLEDLFVHPQWRGRDIGTRLLQELARIAVARDCGRMEWWVLDWNEAAIQFYTKLGAEPMDQWTVQRLNRAQIEALAND